MPSLSGRARRRPRQWAGLWSRQFRCLDVQLRMSVFLGSCTSGAGPGVVSTGTRRPFFDASVGLQGETCPSYTPQPPQPPHKGAISFKGNHLPGGRPVVCVPNVWLRCDGCTRRCWRRHVQCPPPTRAAPALVVATRGVERRGRCYYNPSPQRWPEEVVTRREEQQEGEVHEENDGLRAQTTALPGTRPAPLPVVAGSQGVWPGAPRQPGSVVPSVVPPALAAPAAETVDTAALSFLLAQSLAAQRRLRSRRLWRSWRSRWLRLKTGFCFSFSGNRRRGPGSLVRPGPHSPASSSSPFTGSWPGMRWRRRRVSGRRRRRGSGGVQYVVILGDDGASGFDSGYMHGFRTRILRSILTLLSCSVFAAFGAALVSTTALVCLGWFCWCRRTSCYVPFFCFRVQRTACPQRYILCVSIGRISCFST